MDAETQKWKAIAEQALSAAEGLYQFWEEGFGSAGLANERYAQAVKAYKAAGGNFVYAPDYEQK